MTIGILTRRNRIVKEYFARDYPVQTIANADGHFPAQNHLCRKAPIGSLKNQTSSKAGDHDMLRENRIPSV
jgi:hypothetical protein